jgi:hypothetical protein
MNSCPQTLKSMILLSLCFSVSDLGGEIKYAETQLNRTGIDLLFVELEYTNGAVSLASFHLGAGFIVHNQNRDD